MSSQILMYTGICFLFCFCSGYALSAFQPNDAENGNGSDLISSIKLLSSSKEKIRSLKTSELTSEEFVGKEVFLRIISPMKSQNVTSGDKVQFKCKVDGWPPHNIQFTWYRNNLKIQPRRHEKHFITYNGLSSKLTIKAVYTFDSGVYRCEASNELRRVETSAFLRVLFHRPPPRGKKNEDYNEGNTSSCQAYRGMVCRKYLEQSEVFVDLKVDPNDVEKHVEKIFKYLDSSSNIFEQCRRFLLPALCYYAFPPCHVINGVSRAKKLCKKECELLKSSKCLDEVSNKDHQELVKTELEYIFENFNCTESSSATKEPCLKTEFYAEKIKKPNPYPFHCYTETGLNYLGNINTTETGESCKIWPTALALQDPKLAGHNFCRNPNSKEKKPWCYIDEERKQRAVCSIPLCFEGNQTKSLFLIVFGVSGSLLITGVLFLLFHYSFNKNKHCWFNTRFHCVPIDPSKFVFPQHDINLPQLDSNRGHVFDVIGFGKFTEVFSGNVIGSSLFPPEQTIALKCLKDNRCSFEEKKAFYDEKKVLSKLKHPNIVNVKAVSSWFLVFEYNKDRIDLITYMQECSARLSTKKGACSEGIPIHVDHLDLIEISVQIASGMEYLASNNYIHRDLAARNVFIWGNREIKISNLGVINDKYLSCYCKSPQGDLFPIRWMAPESLQNWQFSDKSPVWSFGVLLWELFSYGSHPYCRYSNQEVLEIILRGQVLSLPPTCPAPVYTLMQKCWTVEPSERPTFQEIRSKLQAWMEVGEVVIMTRQQASREAQEKFPPPPEYSSRPNSGIYLKEKNFSDSGTTYLFYKLPNLIRDKLVGSSN